jgi:lipopolysaccharide transport system ATP-binding protein
VLAVGDAEFQKKAIGKMQDISKGDGRTVLFVSHNMDSVRKLCTRGILLEHGKVSFEGEINKVVDYYLNNEKNKDSENLEFVKDRSGNGKLIATKIEIINGETDKIITEIISGMDVKFRVHYKLLDETLLNKKVVIGLTVRSRNDAFVTVFNNEMIGSELRVSEKVGFFECLINKFPLTYGEFNLRVIFKIDNEASDRIEHALNFYVHDADFFDTGNNNANGRQGVYVQHKWM